MKTGAWPVYVGLAPRRLYRADYAYFEPVHSTAPDIAELNIINPTAMILSAKWMLGSLGFEDAAARLEQAIYAVYSAGKPLTRDQGGSASTTEFCVTVVAGLYTAPGASSPGFGVNYPEPVALPTAFLLP